MTTILRLYVLVSICLSRVLSVVAMVAACMCVHGGSEGVGWGGNTASHRLHRGTLPAACCIADCPPLSRVLSAGVGHQGEACGCASVDSGLFTAFMEAGDVRIATVGKDCPRRFRLPYRHPPALFFAPLPSLSLVTACHIAPTTATRTLPPCSCCFAVRWCRQATTTTTTTAGIGRASNCATAAAPAFTRTYPCARLTALFATRFAGSCGHGRGHGHSHAGTRPHLATCTASCQHTRRCGSPRE